MCEPVIHVLRSVFTRLVQQNLFASVATLRVCFLCIRQWLIPAVTTLHCDDVVTVLYSLTLSSSQCQGIENSDCHCDDVVTVLNSDTDYWTVTTSDTFVTGYPLPWDLSRNLITRHLVGNCIVATWTGARYPVTHRHCWDQGGTDAWFCSHDYCH